MTRSRYRVTDADRPHLLTSTVVAWLPVFTRPEAVQIVLDAGSFLQKEGRLKLFGYVVLENHCPWVASAANLSREIQSVKSYTAHRLIDLLTRSGAKTLLELLEDFKSRHRVESRYQFWQEGSHPEAIFDRETMRQKLEYVQANPVKRGYVDDPTHWRNSSARNYAGLPGLLDVVTEWS